MKSVRLLPLLAWCAVSGVSAAEPEADDGGRASARSIQAQLKQAEEYVVLGEPDAALAKYEQLLAKHGKTTQRFTIRLALGRFYYQQKQFEKAMEHFTRAAGDATGRADHNPDLAARVDALYHVGMCFVELGQHERCFPSFRQVLELAPGSQLANQAYFQIAEAHYANQNFTQAIANYTLVGTSLDGDQIDSHRCELGKPLFIRIQDQDFLIMEGKRIVATVTTSDGDREDVVMRPLRPGSDTYVGSISTALGIGKPGDGDLSATGATKLAIAYQDAQTAAGTLDVPRTADLVFVGDARVAVTDGAFRDAISQVILDQGAGNLNLRVVDLDRDTGDAVDKVEVELLVEQPVAKDELAKDEDKEPKYQERGRLTV
ncbi:MAG: tetratricopeptide repeat protein, partial [Planctomycetes bacterium]|nr:tetratricopeptide repeat protein [Planctomycetota bacterium]